MIVDNPEPNTLNNSSSSPSFSPEQSSPKSPSWRREFALFIADIGLNVVVIVLLVFLIRTYLVSPFRVYGPSMCQTLNYVQTADGYRCLHGNGEYIIVNKLLYQQFLGYKVGQPERGDIIVFLPPNGGKDFFIKRIIGLPGETVAIREEANGSFIYIINQTYPAGFKLDEPYLSKDLQGKTYPARRGETKFYVHQDSYFVMGDNRLESNDSRHCFNALGCTVGSSPLLPRKQIEGKAWLVLWPFQHIRILNIGI